MCETRHPDLGPVNDALEASVRQLLAKEKTDPQPMGIGKIGQPNMIFVRKFRWTLSAPNLPSHFMKSVHIEFTAKCVRFSFYEVIDPDDSGSFSEMLAWLDNPQGPLTFTTYDGCGNPLYRYELSDLRVVSNSTDFDYTSSEASLRKVCVFFSDAKFEVMCSGKKLPEVPKKKFQFFISLPGLGGLPVESDGYLRPRIDIEEIEINHLNSKLWIPGKAKWEPLEFVLNRSFKDQILPRMVAGPFDFELEVRAERESLERWGVSGAKVQQFVLREDGDVAVTLRYDNITYQQAGRV